MKRLNLESNFIFEQMIDVIILADIPTKRICYWNLPATKVYGLDENTFSLEDIFQHCPMTLEEMILKTRAEFTLDQPMAVFPNLFTTKADGSEQFADLTISYANEEETILCFRLYLKEDIRMAVAKEMINNGVKALFLAEISEQMDIFYANDLFYTTFTKSKDAFETYYKNSFMATLLDVEQTSFYKNIRGTLLSDKAFRQDIQISTVHGVKKWFLLELQIMHTGNSDLKILGSLLPIADRIQVSNRLEQMNQYLEVIQELTTGALFYVNAKGTKFTHHSSLLKKRGLATEMDGYPKCVLPLIHEDDVESYLEFSDKMINGSTEDFKFRYKTDSKTHSWAKIHAMPVRDEEGSILELVGRVKNIDDEVELVKQATTDPLTNTLNKEFVKDTVENILNIPNQNPEQNIKHALFFMDLDNFKYVNDNLGHQFGDFLLQELGSRMSSSVRAGDVIGRVGGDEFVFLIRNIPNMSMLLDKAQRLLKTIGNEFNDGKTSHTIGGSVGISVYPEHGTTYDELYQKADVALYRSKKRGKNMATIYKPETSERKENTTSPQEEITEQPS